MERLERQYASVLQASVTLRAAGGQVDIPTWPDELAQFNDAINGAPAVLSPQQQLLRELGVA